MKKRLWRYLPVGLLLLGAVMMLSGVFVRKEHLMVLKKETKICMECIGVG